MNEFEASVQSASALAIALGLAALGYALAARWRARRCVGSVVFRVRSRSLSAALRWTLLVGAALALAASWSTSVVPPDNSLVLVGVTVLLLLLTPAPGDQDCGDSGVRSGWDARRYEDLEAWRLAGEHLRWKLNGEWVATFVPPEDQPRLRQRLLELCPERESPFG